MDKDFFRFSPLGLFAGLVLAMSALTAQAVSIFNFDAVFNTGPESGDMYTGQFSLDGYTGGAETFAPAGNSLALDGDFVDFSITIGADTFTLTDEDQYPEYPAVVLFDGQLVKFDYTTGSSFPYLQLLFLDVKYQPNETADVSEGSIQNLALAQVPEPSTLLLLGSGLVGVAMIRKKYIA